MLSSVTVVAVVLVAIIMAMRTDLRLGEAESGGLAEVNVGIVVVEGGDAVVENRPRQSSGQTVRR